MDERPTRIQMIAATPFFSDRGCHIRILEEARSLAGKGFDVLLSTYHLGSDMPGVAASRSAQASWYRKVTPGASWGKLVVDPLLFIRALADRFRFKPDVIHAHLAEGLLIAFFVRTLGFTDAPIIYDSQGILADEMDAYHFKSLPPVLRRPLHAFFALVERLLLFIPETVVASSESCAEAYVRRYKVRAARVRAVSDGFPEVCPLGETERLEKRHALRAALSIPDDRSVLLYTGSLAQGKGVKEYLDALPRLVDAVPQASFVFAGYGELEEEYRKKYEAFAAGGRVAFLGRVPYAKLAHYASIADYAIDPKQNISESSAKIANYLSLGLPTICFRSPIPALEPYLIKIGSFDDIAGIINGRRLPPSVPESVLARYSWTKGAGTLAALYEDALSSGRKPVAARMIAALAITAVLGFAFARLSSAGLLYGLVSSVDVPLLFMSFAAYAAVYLVRGYRLSLVSGIQRQSDNVAVSIIHTFAVNILPASLGELAYPFMLKRHGASYAKSFGDLTLMRAFDFSNIIVVIASLLVLRSYGAASAIALFVAGFLAVPLGVFYAVRLVHGMLRGKGGEETLFEKSVAFLERLFEHQALHTKGGLLRFELYSVAVAFSMLLYGFVLMRALGSALPAVPVLLGLSLAIIGGGIPLDGFLSFGVTEVGLAAVLASAGEPLSLSAAFAVAHHLFTLLFSAALFAAALAHQYFRTKARA